MYFDETALLWCAFRKFDKEFWSNFSGVTHLSLPPNSVRFYVKLFRHT